MKKIAAVVLLLCLTLSSCAAEIKIQPAQSENVAEQQEYLRPEPMQFYTLENGEIRIGIGEYAQAGIYEKDIKAPVAQKYEMAVKTECLNPGGDFNQSLSGFACGNKLAVLNAEGGAEFEIKISDDAGETWFSGELEKDKAFIAGKMGLESHIGFSTQTDGFLAVNSDTSSLVTGQKNITRLYFTQDGGKTWYRGNAPEDVGNLKIAGAFFETPMKGTIFYQDAADYQGSAEIRHTEDGGATWVRQALKIAQVASGADFQQFRMSPPVYVESSTLENKGEWVLPVRSLFRENGFDYSELTKAEFEAISDFDFIKQSDLYSNSFYVEYPYFLRKGIWALSYDAFISPDTAPQLGVAESCRAIVEMKKILEGYKNNTIETKENELCAFEPMPDYTDKPINSIISYIRKMSYYITHDDVLLLYEDTSNFVSKDVLLVLKQKQNSFEAVGLQITGEGYLYD